MPKYKATIKVDVREYHEIEFEAADKDAAYNIACMWDDAPPLSWENSETFVSLCDDSLDEIPDA